MVVYLGCVAGCTLPIWHPLNRKKNADVRKCELIDFPKCKKGKDTLVRTYDDIIGYDMGHLNLIDGMTHNRSFKSVEIGC